MRRPCGRLERSPILTRAAGVLSSCCAAVLGLSLCRCGDVTIQGGTPAGGDSNATSADASAGQDLPPIIVGPASGSGDDGGDTGNGRDGAMAAGQDGSADAPPDGPTAPACDPTAEPKDAPCTVDDAYGVFVATSGDDTASGTKARPLKTITAGIALAVQAHKPRVYVCQGDYVEQVSLDAQHDGVGLYGGLDCINGWTWSSASAVQVTAPTPLYALRIESTTQPVVVEDMRFTAPAASGHDASGAGGSSIAAFVHAASPVGLRRVTLASGPGADGAAGADGMTTPNYPTSAPTAPPGTGFEASGPMGIGSGPAGVGGVNQCLLFGSSAGGSGGAVGDMPNTSVSWPGVTGTALPAPPATAPNNGLGGQSIPDGVSTNASGVCAPTSQGSPGANGVAGLEGSAAASFGTLTSTAWAPSAGGDGQPGTPGQGGGGGGGTGTQVSQEGQLGGDGGGAGGCGGSGGKGGGGGGASIALVSIDSAITMVGCTLAAADAGNGGAGGAGQAGQGGGAAGTGVGIDGCTAGAGGNGAGGAGGAGGTGGISVGISFHGTLPSYDGATQISVGKAGQPGAPGAKGAHGVGVSSTGSDGAAGAAGLAGTALLILSL